MGCYIFNVTILKYFPISALSWAGQRVFGFQDYDNPAKGQWWDSASGLATSSHIRKKSWHFTLVRFAARADGGMNPGV